MFLYRSQNTLIQMFRILHTSDLHIGKRLHQEELKEDHRLFFNWLVDYIKHNDINALVVAGDVFDVANPSSEARRMYYDLLRELMLVKCKLIITGGNHDSPATLEAPRELLKQLDIHVRGSYNADTNDFLIPIQDHKGETILVVAAIPYLRDSDIRKYQSDESYEDRNEALKNGIAEVFREASQACKDLFPGIPAIAMGHLFIQGGSLSESEREIQIGNLAGLETNRLNDYFSYYALGHLHCPQSLGQDKKLCYSGSPIQLSFSERENKNRVMLLTLDQGSLDVQSIPAPVNRKLIKIKGNVSEIKSKLNNYTSGQNPLIDFIEIEAVEDDNNPLKILELEELVDNFKHPSARILKHRISTIARTTSISDIYDENQNLTELNPLDVFIKRIELEVMEPETKEKLIEAFRELFEETENNPEDR